MENITIEDIANELGIKSKDIIDKIKFVYKDVKSSKSVVSEKDADVIMQRIMDGKEFTIDKKIIPIYSIENINIHFSTDKIDITMLEKIASSYGENSSKNFMIRSFNFSELEIVKILVAGLSNLDMKRYIEMESSEKELEQLTENMNLVLDKVDFEDIDKQPPFKNFKQEIKKNRPKIVYIEGIDFKEIKKYTQHFQLIQALAKDGIKFEIGLVNVDEDHAYIETLLSLLKSKKELLKTGNGDECDYISLPKFMLDALDSTEQLKVKDAIQLKSYNAFSMEVSISNIVKKISKDGSLFFMLDLSDETGKIQACISPDYFEQNIQTYKNTPVGSKITNKVNDNIDLDELAKNRCLVKLNFFNDDDDDSKMSYYIQDIALFFHKNLTFEYTIDAPIEGKNIIDSKECIEEIFNTENYQGYIDYKLALENVTLFEKLASQDITVKITIVNLYDELINTYQNIFDFISGGGNLIHYQGGILKVPKSAVKKRLNRERKLLKDIPQKWYGCIVPTIPSFKEEKQICELILNERERLDEE